MTDKELCAALRSDDDLPWTVADIAAERIESLAASIENNRDRNSALREAKLREDLAEANANAAREYEACSLAVQRLKSVESLRDTLQLKFEAMTARAAQRLDEISALQDQVNELTEKVSSAQRHEDEAVSAAQKQAGRLFLAIVKELAPLFPEDSRELDWDVLPSAVAKVRQRLVECDAYIAKCPGCGQGIARKHYCGTCLKEWES